MNNFSRTFVWDVAIFVSNLNESILTIEFIVVVAVVSRETCRVLVGVRFLKVAILSVCTIIALVHPSRCLREKHEKGCENWRFITSSARLLTFYFFFCAV